MKAANRRVSLNLRLETGFTTPKLHRFATSQKKYSDEFIKVVSWKSISSITTGLEFLEEEKLDSFATIKEYQDNFEEKYEELETLGQGAHGVVKKVICKENNKSYAVKQYRTSDPEMKKAIHDEYEILQSMEHGFIIKAHDFIVSPNLSNINLILEYCPYPTLKKVIKKNGKLKECEAAKVTTMILETLVYLYKRKICHRDIKPSNILVKKSLDDMRLVDFGVAYSFTLRNSQDDSSLYIGTHKSSTILEMLSPTGTQFYKAPEMSGGSFNYKVDMWSLGITLINMVSGKRNLSPKSAIFSKNLENFLSRLLEIDPAMRLNPDFALLHKWIKHFSIRKYKKNASYVYNPKLEYITGNEHKEFDGLLKMQSSYTIIP